MGMFKHKAAPDFAYGKLTSDWIVLEERSMCLVHPLAFNSEWHILLAALLLCLCVCVCILFVYVAACLIQLPETESRAKFELR